MHVCQTTTNVRVWRIRFSNFIVWKHVSLVKWDLNDSLLNQLQSVNIKIYYIKDRESKISINTEVRRRKVYKDCNIDNARCTGSLTCSPSLNSDPSIPFPDSLSPSLSLPLPLSLQPIKKIDKITIGRWIYGCAKNNHLSNSNWTVITFPFTIKNKTKEKLDALKIWLHRRIREFHEENKELWNELKF